METFRSTVRLAGPLFLAFLLPCSISPVVAVDYFTDNGYGNPLAVIQHPCAEFYNGKTYVAYQGPHEDPYVCAYDHAAKSWFGPVKAGVNPMGNTPDTSDPKKVDNHGRPALIVDRMGYIHLIFGGHGGEFSFGCNALGTPGKGRQTHVVSEKPGDISAWKVLDNVSPFGTYSQFVKMDDGDIYLFYRHGSHRSDWVYQKSIDDCRSFSSPVSILKHKGQEADPNVQDSWYAWLDKGKGDTITASYVYHPCKSQGHTKERYNGYYMKMNCGDDTWESASGAGLTLPVTKEEADQKTLVYDTFSAKLKSNHGTCHVDDEGNPHLFFRQQNQVLYFRWLGNAWQGPTAIPGGDGDFIVESPKVVRMLLSCDGGVCWWKTTDGGLTWAKESCPLSSTDSSYITTALVRNGRPESRMVVSENSRLQNHLYRRLYLLGDSGPIGRPEEEASNLGELLKDSEFSPPAPGGKIRNQSGDHTPDE